MNSGNKIIYIPEYVEQGVSKLQDAKRILEDISSEIESGISIINGSGYNRGIPYIEKGDTAAVALEKMKSIISLITSEIEKYSNGEALELESAIIIADPETAEKYGLSKEDIDYTLAEYLFKNSVSPKWDSNFLTASAGSNRYYAADGRLAKETWCDLNPNNLVTLMKKEGIDLDFWIRDDGVYMYGDYVMVAADIPHMDGSEQEAEYRKGDLVETSLGTGIVVDYCGMAEKVRKGELAGSKEGDVEVWYDIYTAWHDGGQYQHVGYCNDSSCTSSYHGTSTMIQKSENPTSTSQLRNTTTQAATSSTVFTTSENTTSTPSQTPTNNTQVTVPVTNTSNSSTSFGGENTGTSMNSKNTNTGSTTTTTPVINNTSTNINSGNTITGGSTNTTVPETNNSSMNTTINTVSSNTNTNTNTNAGSSNANTNTNTNTGSSNTNTNTNTNAGSSNTNTNTNTNAGSSNTNTNTNTNGGSSNTNTNTNTNAGSSNTNTNINTNTGSSNTNTNTNITNTPETNTTIENTQTNNGSINTGSNYNNVTSQITTPNINYENNNYLPSDTNQESTTSEIITPSMNETENMNQTQIITENNQYQSSSQVETIIENNNKQSENNIIKADSSTTQTKEKFNPIPIVAGVGIAAATGVGVKAYVENKKKSEDAYDEEYNQEDENLDEI